MEAQPWAPPIGEAVAKLYERVPVPEANFFGIVINIQQKSGGNLSEALGNLSQGHPRPQEDARQDLRHEHGGEGLRGHHRLAAHRRGRDRSTARAPTTSSCCGPRRAAASWMAGGIFMMVMGTFVMKKMISFDI